MAKPAAVRFEKRRTRDSGLCATNEIPEIPTFCIDNLNNICLGRGTYGVVEKTRYRKSRNDVYLPAAIKYANDSCHIMTLIREAKIMMELNHDNVVRIYGLYDCSRHGRGVVMEYMDCGIIYNQRTIDYSIDHIASWMFQLSSAVYSFHRNNQVHRDLKLQNMLLCDRYRTMKLCDFGTYTNLRQTMTSNRGTPITMAPEVFRCEEYDAKSDIYSIGIIMWQLFSREPPYNVNLSVEGILYKVANANLRPTELTCNPIFSAFWKRCWDNDPNVRPSSQECVEYFGHMRDEFPDGQKPLSDSSTNDRADTPKPRALCPLLNSTSTSFSGTDSRTLIQSDLLDEPTAMSRTSFMKPIDPDVRDETSMRVFNEHCKACENLVQEEQLSNVALNAKSSNCWRNDEKDKRLGCGEEEETKKLCGTRHQSKKGGHDTAYGL
uniref:Mitogen-activated protein kinase kinase kinase n=1 Tax=Caenorhabditis japonica TaxID=281687 RepID=A0A8R1DMA7_CAEJA